MSKLFSEVVFRVIGIDPALPRLIELEFIEAFNKFIEGEPIKPATKMFTGLS